MACHLDWNFKFRCAPERIFSRAQDAGMDATQAALQQHASMMVSTSPSSEGGRQLEQSVLVGASSYCYMLPALALLRARTRLIEAACWTVQANVSFLADYVYVQEASYVHAVDRWGATGLLVLNVAHGLRNLPPVKPPSVTLTYAAGAVAAVSCLALSRNVVSDGMFPTFHALWHLVGALTVCWGVASFRRHPSRVFQMVWRR